jgi:hypothetical protein
MKKQTSRQLIDQIAANNKRIFQAERLEKLSDFASIQLMNILKKPVRNLKK